MTSCGYDVDRSAAPVDRLIGYMRVSPPDDRQSADLKRDPRIAAGVHERHLHVDRASAAKDDRPGLKALSHQASLRRHARRVDARSARAVAAAPPPTTGRAARRPPRRTGMVAPA